MSLYASESSGAKLPPIPEDTYPAICYAIIDLGDQYSEKYDKTAHKCRVLWEVSGETIEVEGRTVNRTISKDYTLSLNEKSALRKDLRAWRGREFTPEELKKFDVKNVLGVPCMLQIIHNKNGENVYANIASISKLPKAMPAPEQTNETIWWNFSDNAVDDETFQKIPQYIQDRIKESQTYTFLTTGDWGSLTTGRQEEIMDGAAFKALHPEGGEFAKLDEDDPNIPF